MGLKIGTAPQLTKAEPAPPCPQGSMLALAAPSRRPWMTAASWANIASGGRGAARRHKASSRFLIPCMDPSDAVKESRPKRHDACVAAGPS